MAFENTRNNNYAIIIGTLLLWWCGEKNDIKVIKNINGKHTISVIIMYHSLSSLFNFNSISDEKNQKDSTYNYSVFDEEGEAIDDKSKLKKNIILELIILVHIN